jgi:site-specific DNA-methyltransferase (adenine-specific)
LPDGLVDGTITSPPYYRQRHYRAPGEVGQEATPQAYVERLASIFQQVWRVTRPTGSLWLVLGDKYANGELMGLPWRVALALQASGWRLRSDVIWQKPNAMPSAVKNRPTTDHEYIFFFSRSKRYFYDADAVREPHVTFSPQSRMRGGRNHFGKRQGTPERGKNGGSPNLHDGRWDQAFHPLGRNKRTVWSVPLSKFREAHFAVFPAQLAATCVQASVPAGGLVLDPFLGSGTTALVAQQLQRDYLGIDCVKDYCDMAQRRLENDRSSLLDERNSSSSELAAPDGPRG